MENNKNKRPKASKYMHIYEAYIDTTYAKKITWDDETIPYST